MNVQEVLAQLLVTRTVDKLAGEIEASGRSIFRWAAGTSAPQPGMERSLRALALKSGIGAQPSAQGQIELSQALTKMREAFHRRGRMSSRNEALDELAKMLFAQTVASRAGLVGIGHGLLADGSEPAIALSKFVASMVDRFLPESLGHEFTAEDFALRLKPGESELALDLIEAFESFSDSTRGVPGDLINDAFGQFIVDSFADEKELGQYLTPSEVVKFMVDLAIDEMTAEELGWLSTPGGFAQFGAVLDPSCGVGSFLAEFIRSMHEQLPSDDGDTTDWSAAASRSLVVGLDKSERMMRLALTNLATFGATSARLHLGNSLARTGPDSGPTRELEGTVGLILTNPPFGATFKSEEVREYRIASEWSGSPSTVDSELLFMERYIDWLRPGGQLIAVVPDSILTNRGLFASLRKGLSSHIEIRSVVSLPPVTFAAAGTSTKTSIIHLRKGKQSDKSVRFAVCSDIGYTVTKRRKTHTSEGDLPSIRDALRTNDSTRFRAVADVDESGRWDASFHASPSSAAINRASVSESALKVRDVATLSDERVNPRRLPQEFFQYIEISDVDGDQLSVSSKTVPTNDPASRARMVARAGDVLVSTVRPEKGAVGVVPQGLDGAVCTTGFGVLRPFSIHPHILAALLRTDFVKQQFLKNNVGIAYPAIDAGTLADVVLPITKEELGSLHEAAENYAEAARLATMSKNAFDQQTARVTDRWVRAAG